MTPQINATLVSAALQDIVFPDIFHAEIYKGYLIVGCIKDHYYIYKNGKTDKRRWRHSNNDSLSILRNLIDVDIVRWDPYYSPPL